jgi:hypothetical protein
MAGDTTAPPLTKDPTTAVLYSLLLPGLGQYYTEDYWKIPLFTGGCATAAGFFFYYNSKFNEASDLYDQLEADGQSSTVLSAVRSQRESYRDNRDLAGVLFLAGYVLAAVDAYTGAHLYDFDVTDDLSMSVLPAVGPFSGLTVQLRW